MAVDPYDLACGSLDQPHIPDRVSTGPSPMLWSGLGHARATVQSQSSSMHSLAYTLHAAHTDSTLGLALHMGWIWCCTWHRGSRVASGTLPDWHCTLALVHMDVLRLDLDWPVQWGAACRLPWTSCAVCSSRSRLHVVCSAGGKVELACAPGSVQVGPRTMGTVRGINIGPQTSLADLIQPMGPGKFASPVLGHRNPAFFVQICSQKVKSYNQYFYVDSLLCFISYLERVVQKSSNGSQLHAVF